MFKNLAESALGTAKLVPVTSSIHVKEIGFSEAIKFSISKPTHKERKNDLLKKKIFENPISTLWYGSPLNEFRNSRLLGGENGKAEEYNTLRRTITVGSVGKWSWKKTPRLIRWSLGRGTYPRWSNWRSSSVFKMPKLNQDSVPGINSPLSLKSAPAAYASALFVA